LLVSISGVSPAERYSTIGELNDATVGDGDSVGIPRKVLDDVLGPIERWLRIDNPLDLLQVHCEAVERNLVGKRVRTSEESKLATGIGLSNKIEKLSTEHLSKHLHGKEVLEPAT
jgi:hypothetical protein